MGVPELIMFTIGVGLMFLSRALYRPPKGDRNKRDDQPTNLSSRGEWVNYVLGTRKVGCLIGYAWDRDIKQERTSGGKGRPKTPKQDVYYEKAWHQIAVGPVEALEAIKINGDVVWDTRITRDNTPAGTTLELPNGQGAFTIYWGEMEQPINQEIAQAIGIASQWPLLCYIVWQDYQLGNTPRWPQIEYVITTRADQSGVPGNSYLGEAPNGGVNPAFALAQILMANFPHGLGLPADLIEGPTSQTIQYLRNEGLSMNLMVDLGSEAERVIQAICQDAGIFLSYENGRMRFMLQRDDVGGEPPVLDDDAIVPPDIQRRVLRGEKDLNRPVFTYKHRKNWEFRDFDVQIADDGEMSQAGSAAANRVDMPTITDPDVANIVANRRVQENETEASVRVRALRSARRLIPGQSFLRNGQRYRITSVRWVDDSPGIEIDAVLDTYGFAPSDASQNVTPPTPDIRPVEPDKAFAWILSPTNPNAIMVFRLRSHRQINGAFVYASANGGSYILIGSQNTAAAGGELEGSISANSDEILAQSPPFEDAAGDAAGLPDLSGDTAAWQAGDLVCKINDEIMYAQSVSVLPEAPWLASTAYQEGDAIIPANPTGYRYVCVQAGTSSESEPVSWPTQQGNRIADGDVVWEARHFRYRANNLIRNRRDTQRAEHSQGSTVYLITATDLAAIAHPMIQGGNSLCVKSVPFTESATADISTINPVCGSLDPDVEGTIITTDQGDYLVTTTGDFLVTGE